MKCEVQFRQAPSIARPSKKSVPESGATFLLQKFLDQPGQSSIIDDNYGGVSH